MKRTIALLSILCVSITLVYAQAFVEITDYGWGQGKLGTTPYIIDIDNDGLLDLIVGEGFGNLNHYEQESIASYNFVLITENFSGIEIDDISAPCFFDIDNDGLLDLIVGESTGHLYHYEQESIVSYNFELITENFNGIDIGRNSKPYFVDIDDDGLLDLIVGEHSGNLNHFEQESLGSYSFDLITENFNGVDVGLSSKPNFTDIDDDGLFDLIVGDYDGNLNHFEQESIASYNFVLITSPFNGIDVGSTSAPFFSDIDDDGLLDMILGEGDGNLNHFEQESLGSYSFDLITEHLLNSFNVGGRAKPCFFDIDNDGLLDMIVGEHYGNLNHFEQESINSYNFELITENFNGIDLLYGSSPCFFDIDDDGLLDMILGEDENYLNHYEQVSLGSYNFELITENFNGIHPWFKPCFFDINDNGLLDMIVGDGWDNLYHYEQESLGSYNFELITENFSGIDVEIYPAPYFVDIDDDGLHDLLIGVYDGGIHFFRQIIIPEFTADPRFGYSNLNVSFSNLTIGNPTNISWDFENDGIYDSYLQNPTHVYPEQGLYSVKLKVEKSSFQDSLIKTNYIVVQVQELNAPQNLLINENNNNIILLWNSVINADYYLIYKAENPNDDFQFLDYTTGNSNTTYTHAGIVFEEDKLFYFVIGFDGTMDELNLFINQNQVKVIENSTE